jgi:F0F1-type ATP synthase assembly protein I
MSQKKKSDKRDPFLVSASGMGTQFAVAIGLFVFAGIKFDDVYGSSPWGVLGGVALAFVYGIYEVWKLLRKMR